MQQENADALTIRTPRDARCWLWFIDPDADVPFKGKGGNAENVLALGDVAGLQREHCIRGGDDPLAAPCSIGRPAGHFLHVAFQCGLPVKKKPSQMALK